MQCHFYIYKKRNVCEFMPICRFTWKCFIERLNQANYLLSECSAESCCICRRWRERIEKLIFSDSTTNWTNCYEILKGSIRRMIDNATENIKKTGTHTCWLPFSYINALLLLICTVVRSVQSWFFSSSQIVYCFIKMSNFTCSVVGLTHTNWTDRRTHIFIN